MRWSARVGRELVGLVLMVMPGRTSRKERQVGRTRHGRDRLLALPPFLVRGFRTAGRAHRHTGQACRHGVPEDDRGGAARL